MAWTSSLTRCSSSLASCFFLASNCLRRLNYTYWSIAISQSILVKFSVRGCLQIFFKVFNFLLCLQNSFIFSFNLQQDNKQQSSVWIQLCCYLCLEVCHLLFEGFWYCSLMVTEDSHGAVSSVIGKKLLRCTVITWITMNHKTNNTTHCTKQNSLYYI